MVDCRQRYLFVFALLVGLLGGCGFFGQPRRPSGREAASNPTEKSRDSRPEDSGPIQAARARGTIDAFAELRSNPALAKKAALLAFEVAVNKDKVGEFEASFGDVPYKELARLVAASTTLRKSDDLEAYAKAHGDAVFSTHTQRFVKAKVHKAQNVIEQAKVALRKSPITKEWDVDVLGYVDGNIYIYVTKPPVREDFQKAQGGTSSFGTIAAYGQAAGDARKKSCALVKRKVTGIETCLTANDSQKMWFVIPRPMAAKMVYEKFYQGTLDDSGADLRQALLLLHQMAGPGVPSSVIDQYLAASTNARLFAAREYWALGLKNTGIATLIDYVRRRAPPGPSVKAKRLLKDLKGLASDPRVMSLLEAYARFGPVRKGKKWIDADVAGS